MNFTQGEIIAVDKPYRLSSFAAVARLRWLLTQRLGRKIKVGHAGTLDPLATGVLLLCTGRATKRIEALQQEQKEYVAELRLGATTASYDLEHPENATFPTAHITLPLVEEAVARFVGDVLQTPPAYSACKIDGKRAYHYMRSGKEVTPTPKTVTIYSIVIEEFRLPYLRLRVTCGKGTYIRSLARDIGEALKSGAYLTSLRRTRAGGFTESSCIAFDKLEEWAAQVSVEDEPA